MQHQEQSLLTLTVKREDKLRRIKMEVQAQEHANGNCVLTANGTIVDVITSFNLLDAYLRISMLCDNLFEDEVKKYLTQLKDKHGNQI